MKKEKGKSDISNIALSKILENEIAALEEKLQKFLIENGMPKHLTANLEIKIENNNTKEMANIRFDFKGSA